MNAEAMVARDARRVLDNPERPPTSDLGRGLASLLALHLPSLTFGELLHPTLRIRPDYRIEVRGLLQFAQWVELFGADLQPAEDRDVLLDYTLTFGRKDLPDRRILAEQRAEILPELRRSGEWSWLHVFRKPSVT